MPTAPSATQIGDYLIEEELGRGAHGVVYRARHRRGGDPVALKVVEDRGNRDRLLLEPAMLSRLDHPCIVHVEDYFLRRGDLVVALEYIDGKDLKTSLDAGERFDQDQIQEMLVQMAGALVEAHGNNIIHRDIKPSNILVVRESGRFRYVLTDFGIGQVAEGIQAEKHTGGTYLFMAPEQLRGRPAPQSDLWALGVVAYRMLTGRMPFPGPSLGELSNQILYAAPVPPSQCCAEPVDPDLEAVIMRLLDRSLSERVGSAEELLRLLGRRGDSTQVLRQTARAPKRKGGRSLDQNINAGIAWRQVMIVLLILFYLVPTGLASAVFLLSGMALFYRGQKEDRRDRAALFTALALLLLGINLVVTYWLQDFNLGLAHVIEGGSSWIATSRQEAMAVLNRIPPVLFVIAAILGTVLLVVLYITYLLVPVIAGSLYATVRRLRRERILRDVAMESGTDSDHYLQALRGALDTRFEDVGLHLKYAEALYARGRLEEAAVEARVLLHQDPYNFNGNLLLANAYLALGLPAEAEAVCNDYLAISGYCFELAELREQSRRRLAS